ncbi:MAG: HAMP domain-containing histidine kinase [candidate division KSB1 bacterium]|nr:HAMP domain-containing histidine kinase [candidate division KSB1 bacterium]MDZ7300651.1 HAMP domain-containing histidine kinase [candidate division KSB1 bacterium]MDZ7309788.1 HAMP domain-containing histidine kinase [candidate division KSB1 bacterium]
MTLTIRSRLTIWFTLAFSAVLVLVVGVVALKLYSQVESETREILRNEERWISALVASEFLHISMAQGSDYDSLAADLNENLEERYGLKQQFAVLAIPHNAQLVFYSGGMKDVDQLLPADFFERRAGNYNLIIADDRYRVRLFRRGWGAAAVGILNERIFEVAEEAGKILVWLVPLAMLFAIAGGWLLAKLALRPVVAAARTAESISLANLKKRLPEYTGKDEFGALVATLNRMIARLEEGVKRLQQFTQDAAHELRTPLTILRGDLELAYQDENVPEETRAWLQRILDRVIALGQIVDNLMLLARSDSGNYPIHKTRFRLDLVVKEVFEDMQILAEGRPLAVHLQNDQTVEFYGDEMLMRRLILNLCDNAMKYTSQGIISLSLKKADAKIELTISDTGKGIPAEDLPHIFDRFYRVDKSHSSATGGSGLGLAICHWIVTAHSGRITVTSELGKGTTVRVFLPNTLG